MPNLIKRESAKDGKRLGGKGKGGVGAGKDRRQKKGKDDKKRINFEEYIQAEEEIKKGLESGEYFEGLFRINPNNRNRAFVSIDGLSVDVMIDGLGA